MATKTARIRVPETTASENVPLPENSFRKRSNDHLLALHLLNQSLEAFATLIDAASRDEDAPRTLAEFGEGIPHLIRLHAQEVMRVSTALDELHLDLGRSGRLDGVDVLTPASSIGGTR
jgi:hypothetical protein